MSLLKKVKHSFSNGAMSNGNGNDNSLPEDLHVKLLDNVPSPVTYVGRDFHYKYVNKACAIWYDAKVEDIIGKPVKDFLSAETYQRVKPYMDKAMSGEQVHFESEVQLKKSKRFVEITYTPDPDKSGVVKGYIALVNDITEKRDAENKLITDIDDRRQMEETLLDSEIRYRTLVEQLPAALYICDAEGRITLFNKAAADLWGREPEIGKDMWCGSWKIYEPDGITPMALDTCPMAITLKEGRPVTGKEIIIERPDGKRVNVQPSPAPLFNKNGKITGALNMLLDITDRKEAEKGLSNIAAIIHSSADPIISKTLTGIITSWNEAAERVFGYTAGEMIGQPITKLIPDDRLNEETLIMERLKRGEMVEHFETKRITKDKKILDISLTISPVKDKNGNIIGASKISRDITAQKILHEALRVSEERLRIVSEATELGIWEFDPITKELTWSDECKKIYGVPHDFQPTAEFVSEYMHPEDKDYVHNELAKAMDPNSQRSFQMLYRIFRPNDKQLRWLKIHGKVYFNDEKQPKRFIGNMLDITDEKHAEQLILESEERLRLAIQSTKLGTWEFFPMTGILTWSDECRKIYGVPENMEVDYELFSKYIYPDDIDLAQNAIQQAMETSGNDQYDIQFRILRYSDKQVRWIKAQGKVFFNNKGQAERFIGTVLDITEEKIREQELKDSVDLFTTMADNVPVMIWMSGEDKFCDFFNKTWLEFTGRTMEEESNEGWLENVHPDDVQNCIDNYRRSFEEQKGFYTEYRLKRYDGKYRWIADNSVPRYNMDDSFAGFISACLDIDEQQRYREKIMENELLLKTISSAAPVGLWIADTNGQNTFVNDTWVKWTGIPFEKQLGTGWLDKVIEEDRINAPSKFMEAMSKREKYSSEFRFIRNDGELRWGYTEGSPYYDTMGEFVGYAGSVTDITDIKKMEERKDDFIKMASHELKTPITSIKGYVQLLLNIYDEVNEEKFRASRNTVRSSLSTISKQVSKLTRLVSELLDLSRIESGKLELYKTEFDLGALVEETVQDVRHTTTHHAIIVSTDIQKTVYADKDRIAQVLLNLLTNAIKYSPDSDNIEVTVEGNKTHSIIKVKDHGIGIDKKDHNKIFERFYRVEGKSEQTYPGFGIGLFIACEIVQRHDGTISVESKKDRGSVFTVTLPFDAKKKAANTDLT